MEINDKIIEVLDKLRPYLVNDGGDLEFVKFEDGIVYIKLVGACMGCPMASITLKEGIEAALVEEIKEVKEVVNVA